MSAPSSPSNTDRSQRLNEILAAYLQQIDAGHAPQDEALLAAHPEFAEELREFLAGLRRLQQFGQGPPTTASPEAANPADGNLAAPPQESSLQVEPTLPSAHAAEAAEPRRVRYFGEYELLEEIARGGMGVVYRARQASLKRTVALKMILAGQFADAADVRRFYTEAQAAARLEHPHIVPIFEIGQHEGQHYFTMALVEGENLARHVARGVFAPRTAAEIMAKVARAIAYAHAEGVVHRDLKPANILLDAQGEPHVTDFGLAKRVAARGDEESSSPATATGQVLGTPSFMPPEQAAGRNAEVGPLSDVYSLGAVLYCLLVGRAPFQAANPLDTLLQVLDADPVPPRQVDAAVPRDLNTICLKCLAKEPGERYPSAAALADDLERYLRDEPILARPAGPLERLLRLARKQERAARRTAAVAAATAVLWVGAWWGWGLWQSIRMAEVVFKGETAQTAELLDLHGRPLMSQLSVPTKEPIRVLRGEYRLRLSAPGRPSETWLLGINEGRNEFTLKASDRWPWRPLGLEPESCFDLLGLPDRTDLVVLERRFGKLSMRRLDGRTASVEWEIPLDPNQPPVSAAEGSEDLGKTAPEPGDTEQPAPSGEQPAVESDRPDRTAGWAAVIYFIAGELSQQPPALLVPPPDLDGDNVPDVVWLSRRAHLLAVAGRDGRVLWWHDVQRGGRLLGRPAVCALPGVGSQVLLAVVAASGAYFLDAIRSTDGARIWRVPLRAEWFAGNEQADWGAMERVAMRVPQPEVIECSGAQVAAITTATHLVMVPLGRDVPMPIGRPYVEAAALDWDTRETPRLSVRPRLLHVRQGEDSMSARVLVCFAHEGQAALCCLDVASWTQVWQWRFSLARLRGDGTALFEIASLDGPELTPDDWPLIADLDGDGAAELLVPGEVSAAAEGPDTSALWGRYGVYLLDAATGRPRWKQVLYPRMARAPHFAQLLTAPDLDGDGCQDMLVCSLGAPTVPWRSLLFIDAISGREGGLLASWHLREIGVEGDFTDGRFHRAAWWEPHVDGWPSLLVLTSREQYPQPRQAMLHAVSLFQGTETQFLTGMQQVRLADLSGDGLADLCFRRQSSDADQLQCLVARPAEAWRRLGRVEPLFDLDADGCSELLEAPADGIRAAECRVLSGRTGLTVAHLRLEVARWDIDGLGFRPGPDGDLDGDGLPDLVVPVKTRAALSPEGGTFQLPLRAVSTGTGAWLWDRPAAPFDSRYRTIVSSLSTHLRFIEFSQSRPRLEDLDGDQKLEVLCPYWVHQSRVQQPCLAVLAGHTGHVLWNETLGSPLEEGSLIPSGSLLAETCADLDADGWRDLVVSAPLPRPDETILPAQGTCCPNEAAGRRVGVLEARSGRDGSRLWARQLSLHPDVMALSGPPHKLVVDLEDDGVHEVLYLDAASWNAHEVAAWRLVMLNGRDGQVRAACTLPGSSLNGAPPLPLVARLSHDAKVICVPTWDEKGLGLWVCSSKGEVLRRFAIDTSFELPLVVADLNGDGLDELVYWRDRRLCAGDGAGRFLWRWPAAAGLFPLDELQLLGPAQRASSPRLLVRSGRTVVVLDAVTGRPVWRSEGLGIDHEGNMIIPSPHWLLPRGDQTLPLLLAQGRYATARALLPVDERGKIRAGMVRPLAHRPPSAIRPDPRRLVFLPWGRGDPPAMAEVWVSLGLAALVLLPGWMLYHLACVGMRLRSLGLLLALVTAAFVWIVLLHSAARGAFGEPGSFSQVAFAYGWSGLVWLFPFLVLLRAAQRRWRAVAWLVGTAALLGALVLAIGSWEASTRLAAGQSLAWRGWYLAWLWGAVVSGLLCAGTWILRAVLRSFGWRGAVR